MSPLAPPPDAALFTTDPPPAPSPAAQPQAEPAVRPEARAHPLQLPVGGAGAGVVLLGAIVTFAGGAHHGLAVMLLGLAALIVAGQLPRRAG